MNRCIYCGKDKTQVAFRGREHVIPELLGVFENNLTLIGCVCDNCNTKIFGPLETMFKEDTHEGIMYQRFNFSDSYQIRIRNKNYKMSTEMGFSDSFFNEAFPFIKIYEGKPTITFLPQIKARGYAGNGYLILLVDKIKELPRNGKKFKKLVNILNGVGSKDVSIFTHGGDDPQSTELNGAIELVRELGVPYKPGQQKILTPTDLSDSKKKVEINVEGKIDSSVVRVLAKIAFNYFAYCAIQSGYESILHHSNFSKIKEYVLGTVELPLKDIIINTPTSDPIIKDESEMNIRLIGHTIIFDIEDGRIVSKICLLGGFVYPVCLGQIPDELNKEGFGSGHVFDPRNKKIWGLTKNEAKRGRKDPRTFSLFNSL